MNPARKAFLLSTTGGIAAMMFYCALSERELFPFAPYTMYSFRQEPSMDHYQIYLTHGKERVVATQSYLEPLDEARIKTSIEGTIKSNAKTVEKLKAIYANYLKRRESHPDLGQFDGIVLTRETWGTIEALRKNKIDSVEVIAAYAP